MLEMCVYLKVFVVGHDWGAIVAWNLCMFRSDLVRGVVALSVAYMPRDPLRKPIDTLRLVFGDDYYICAFQVCCFSYLIHTHTLKKIMSNGLD